MSEIIIRNPHIREIPALGDIWHTVFGGIGIKSFFEHLFNIEMCMTAEVNDFPAAVGYLVPTGDIVRDGASIPCAMIYSVATLPKYRGMGLGTAIVHELICLARKHGYPAVVLCPSDDGLFEYYSAHTELRDWFYTNEQIITQAPDNTCPSMLTEIPANEYHSLREELLKDIVHIQQKLRILEYQALLCDELGGGLFQIGDSCAVVECQSDGAVWVKELLKPGGNNDGVNSDPDIMSAISSIASKFPAREYVVKSPSIISEGRRFGMLAFPDFSNVGLYENPIAPWYGMAFD